MIAPSGETLAPGKSHCERLRPFLSETIWFRTSHINRTGGPPGAGGPPVWWLGAGSAQVAHDHVGGFHVAQPVVVDDLAVKRFAANNRVVIRHARIAGDRVIPGRPL